MIGEKLGKYTILDIVGNGSMGSVFKAEDPEGRLVAIKLIRSQVLFSREKRERFLQCVLIASEMRHRGICPILDIADDNDDFFIITPFIAGKTLQMYRGKKELPWPMALDIALETGDAISAIHEAGAAHRGLNPANIWILQDQPLSVLISDCCIARFTEITDQGKLRNTGLGADPADTVLPLDALSYMSPEQVRGEPLDCRTDIYSFGAILYEMLSGRHPFASCASFAQISAILDANPPPLKSKLTIYPVGLNSILQKALAKNPENRYQKISDMLAELRLLRDRPVPSSRACGQLSFGIRNWLASFRRSESQE
jgi:serine/threonine protein kinase